MCARYDGGGGGWFRLGWVGCEERGERGEGKGRGGEERRGEGERI